MADADSLDDLKPDPPDLTSRVELDGFIPITMEYINNRLGFGRSWPIELI